MPLPKYYKAKRIIVGLTTLLIIAFLLKACVYPYVPITFPVAYGFVKSQWQPHTVSHFPAPLPQDASIEQLYHNHGALQSASILQIRVKFSSQQSFQQELQKLQHLTLTPETASHLEDYPRPNFIIPNNLKLTPLHLHTKSHWNHGETRGYAADPNTHQIYYWTTSW